MQQQETRQVVTICGSMRYGSKDHLDYLAPILLGHTHINEYINGMARQVTIHSVSYHDTVLSADHEKAGTYRYWLFATVVFSGDFTMPEETEKTIQTKTFIELDLDEMMDNATPTQGGNA